jgi:hypothetical protein
LPDTARVDVVCKLHRNSLETCSERDHSALSPTLTTKHKMVMAGGMEPATVRGRWAETERFTMT